MMNGIKSSSDFLLSIFRLSTFSIAANNIAKIEVRALEPIHQITILSLQNNQLISMTSSDGTGTFSNALCFVPSIY